jgi:signal transduction histidine kinase
VFLLSKEFRVRAAPNGRAALDLVMERAPDLVVTDVMMPLMSGTDLCRAIKADPATRGIPVVVVTSKAEHDMKVQGLEAGADDYVTKPFHPRELLARVRSFVRVRKLQAELEQRNADLATALEDLKSAQVQLVESERRAAVGELAAGVAHEVNNPVNFALNAARALRGEVLDVSNPSRGREGIDGTWSGSLQNLLDTSEDSSKETLASIVELSEIVENGLERTQRLVKDLRDFAAPDRGAPTTVGVSQGLKSTVELLRPSYDEEAVRIDLELPDEELFVRANQSALNQVLLNLVKNAAEAVEPKGGRVLISAYRSGTWVVVSVEDNGPGIPESDLARVFEPFVTTKPAGQGTGLGLSVSKRIAEEAGGSLEVRSGAEGGASFELFLPGTELL